MPQGYLKGIKPGVFRGPNDDLPPDQWKIGYELEYVDGEKAFHLFDLGITSQLAQALSGLVQLVKREIRIDQEKDLQQTEEKLGFPVDKVGVSERVKVSLKSADDPDEQDDEGPIEGLSIGG